MEVDSTTSMENDQDHTPTSSSSPSSTPQTTSSSSPSSPMEKDAQQQQQQIVGPRCAPSYTDANAITEKKEDGPGPRCGHTLTAVPAVGEEGSPGYIGPRLILFGGATALEGNSAAAGTPSAGSAGISMLLDFFFFHLAVFSVLMRF